MPNDCGNFTPGMYQDTSEMASATEERAALAERSCESFQYFGGAVGRGHNHGVSAEETVLSPECLSNDV